MWLRYFDLGLFGYKDKNLVLNENKSLESELIFALMNDRKQILY